MAPNANVEGGRWRVLGKIQHPALINLRIASAPVTLVQTYPAHLPDLFYGEELVVFGRYHGTGNGDVVVTGERNGRTERFTARAVFPGRRGRQRLRADAVGLAAHRRADPPDPDRGRLPEPGGGGPGVSGSATAS